MIRFTIAELNNFNGQGGARAYIAYQGKVYDVSSSYFWRGGKHWVRHFAGTDLTGEITSAPHDASMLDRFPVVGFLDE